MSLASDEMLNMRHRAKLAKKSALLSLTNEFFQWFLCFVGKNYPLPWLSEERRKMILWRDKNTPLSSDSHQIKNPMCQFVNDSCIADIAMRRKGYKVGHIQLIVMEKLFQNLIMD